MKIFIPMGYVSKRRGARLHLDIDGIAHCHSGGRRIIASGELTEASATKICRHCEAALRTQMIWRNDDLYRLIRLPDASAERAAIDTLFDALDDLDTKATHVEMTEKIRGNMLRLAQQAEPRRVEPYVFTATTAEIDENQASLF